MAGTAELKARLPYTVLVRGTWRRGRVDERSDIVEPVSNFCTHFESDCNLVSELLFNTGHFSACVFHVESYWCLGTKNFTYKISGTDI